MSICTKCGLSQDYCECSSDIEFEELSYSNTRYEVPDNLITAINTFKKEHRGDLNQLSETLENAEHSARNVRLAYLWSVASVKTKTDTVDQKTRELEINDFGKLKAFLNGTTDHGKKWELAHNFWTTDIPEHTARHLLKGDVIGAQAALSGLNVGAARDFHYMRPTKANMVTRLLGDTDSLCLDSRRHRVLRPLLKDMLKDADDRPRPGADSYDGKYRSDGTPTNAETLDAWSVEFLQDRLERNPRELRAITTEILDALTRRTIADRDEIGHILFCLGGPTTFHESLQKMLE